MNKPGTIGTAGGAHWLDATGDRDGCNFHEETVTYLDHQFADALEAPQPSSYGIL